jgi:hypothetical protein
MINVSFTLLLLFLKSRQALGTWFELESIPVGCGGTLEWDHAAWVQARRSAAASLGGGGQQAAAEVGSLGSLAESPVLES